MSCQIHDKHLLLMAHGALDPVRRFWTERHLAQCPDCRARQATLENASQALAFGVRGDALPAWAGPVQRTWGARPLRPALLPFAGVSTAWIVLLMAACLAASAAVAYVAATTHIARITAADAAVPPSVMCPSHQHHKHHLVGGAPRVIAATAVAVPGDTLHVATKHEKGTATSPATGIKAVACE